MEELINDEVKRVLERQLNNLKQEMKDNQIQVRGIDFNVEEMYELEYRIKKKRALDSRHELMQRQFQLSMDIEKLQTTLFKGTIKTKDNTEVKQDDGN